MRFVAMRELRINASSVLDLAEKEDVVVTRNGKPAAALVHLDEDLLEDFIMAKHPTFYKSLEAARKEYLKKGGITLDEMRRRLARRHG